MAGDFAGYFDEGSTDATPAVEVVLFGLSMVIPMMTKSMMDTPRITTEYMKLINNIMELYPDKLIHLPPNLFSSLMESIVFGLDHASFDISRLAFDAVAALGEQYKLDASSATDARIELLAKSLDLFLRQILEILYFKVRRSKVLTSFMLSRTTTVI
jgi:hypothetical protein